MRLQLAGFAQLALCCAKFGRLLTSAVELEVITTFVFGLYKIVQEFDEANRQCAMVQPNGKGGTASYRILIVHNHKNSRHSGVIVQPVRESIWKVLHLRWAALRLTFSSVSLRSCRTIAFPCDH